MYKVTKEQLQELAQILGATEFKKFRDGMPFANWIQKIEQYNKELEKKENG